MGSEISPFWYDFMLGAGVAAIVLAVMSMATGRLTITRNHVILRDERPGVFWVWIAAAVALGIGLAAVWVLHTFPGS